MNRFEFSCELMELEAEIKRARAMCFKKQDFSAMAALKASRLIIDKLIDSTLNTAETQFFLAD